MGGYMQYKDSRTEKIISAWLEADPATQDEVLEMLQSASSAKKAQQHQELLDQPRSVTE